MAGASEADLDAVESVLGVRLPAALRELLGQTDGFEGWYGDVYLAVYGTDALVAVNLEIERHPGFLASEGATFHPNRWLTLLRLDHLRHRAADGGGMARG